MGLSIAFDQTFMAHPAHPAPSGPIRLSRFVGI
jgi:hypothetical protein